MSRAKKHNFTQYEDQTIVDNYARTSSFLIQQDLLPYLTINQIQGRIKRLRRNGHDLSPVTRQRIHQYNELFFEQINNLNSYWAGFIAADGNINKNNTHLKITLKRDDKEHLEKFRTDIQYSGKIIDYDVVRNDKIYPQSSIRICSAKICSDLTDNFGIISKKSLVLHPPKNLTFCQAIHFILGYTDGDGQINIYKSETKFGHRLRIGWAGTEEMMEWIRIQINKLLVDESKHKLRKLGNIKEYFIEGKRALELGKKLDIYNRPRMDRKWNNLYIFEGKYNEYKNSRRLSK